VQLLIGEPGDGRPDARRVGLGTFDFEGLALDLGFRTGREILADALTIQPPGDPENDIPGGIREL
jgi:hypothetical protein